jgi:hypothetical protein
MTEPHDLTERILTLVRAERARQNEHVASGRWRHTCADAAMDDYEKLAVLGEEFGEVARALLERRPLANLRDELVQVAAVAVAWAESADSLITQTSAHEQPTGGQTSPAPKRGPYRTYALDVPTDLGETITVNESSEGDGPRVWLRVEGEAVLDGEPRPDRWLDHGIAPGYVAANCDLRAAAAVRDALDQWISEQTARSDADAALPLTETTRIVYDDGVRFREPDDPQATLRLADEQWPETAPHMVEYRLSTEWTPDRQLIAALAQRTATAQELIRDPAAGEWDAGEVHAAHELLDRGGVPRTLEPAVENGRSLTLAQRIDFLLAQEGEPQAFWLRSVTRRADLNALAEGVGMACEVEAAIAKQESVVSDDGDESGH